MVGEARKCCVYITVLMAGNDQKQASVEHPLFIVQNKKSNQTLPPSAKHQLNVLSAKWEK